MKHSFALLLSLTICFTAFASAAKEPPRLLLPEEFYAVPGLETNVYFKNVFRAIDHGKYFFQVKCRKGSLMKNFWTFIPKAKDIGTYDWTLTVFDDNGKVAEKTIKFKVLPIKNFPKGASILLIGDSLTDQSHYVLRLKKVAPGLKMIGSNGGLGKSPAKTGIAHEGYGGWRWDSFARESKPFIPKRLSYRTNKFVTEKNGRWQISFDHFFKKYNNGAKPQFVTIQLGGNDIFSRNDQNIDAQLRDISKSMDKLIAGIRKSAPDAFIGIGMVPAAAGQDAWGKGYGCQVNSYQFMKNRWKLNHFYMKKLAEISSKDKKISLIPGVLAIDPDNGFPMSMQRVNIHDSRKELRQRNALHPNSAGGAQLGDVYYCWLMNCLSKK